MKRTMPLKRLPPNNCAVMAAETDMYQRPPRCAMRCPMIAFSNSCAEEAPQAAMLLVEHSVV